MAIATEPQPKIPTFEASQQEGEQEHEMPVRFTRRDCLLMERLSILPEKYELINGEIINKMRQNIRHGRAVMMLIAWLLSVFGKERIVTQNTMEVREQDAPTNKPEPDVIVLREGYAATENPTGQDVLLAVEVSDTTQGRDYKEKYALYAKSGVAEYWILDTQKQTLEVFRAPEGEEWKEHETFTPGQSVAPLVAPGQKVSVAELLA